ncbi:MAG: NAD(P)-binding protein [Nitrospiraceae bacterium]|nr:NAD(P)-binding protein [Nitrospiraceae bacterium]
MKQYNYIIIGAGPSGLAFAHTLKQLGETSFLLIEKESVAGGLCRSAQVEGAPLDIGGGHFLDEKRRDVLDLLFSFLPREDWKQYSRISKIKLHGAYVDYPLEANLWQLPIADQLDFLESIAEARFASNASTPQSFEDWIVWHFGKRVSREYMLPYNRKIWSVDLSTLGTDWLYKLPDVSFRQTLQSCLERQPYGKLPAHRTFLYPAHSGFGEVWRRMGESLGDSLILSSAVTSVDIRSLVVNRTFKAKKKIINTIPWPLWPSFTDIPSAIGEQIKKLKWTSIDVDYYSEDLPTNAQWIYDPDENVPHHRLLCRNNFCQGSRGHWTETNSLRAKQQGQWHYRNIFAYPVSTIEKPRAVESISDWAGCHHIVGLGRWGTWAHMNCDVAVSEASDMARRLLETPF